MARLTAVAIKAAKGKTKPYKLSDSEGLYLLVKPNGRRYWRMNYRHLGKQKSLAFGIWPDVSLADAREKRRAARHLLAKGTDPSDQAKLDKIAASVAAANTFESIAKEWLSKIEQDGLSPVTLKKIRWLLSFTYPSFGNRPITEISAHELLPCARWKSVVAMIPRIAFAALAARSFAMPLRLGGRTAIFVLTLKVRLSRPR